MTPSEAPKDSQASECSELLDLTRANCWISAQHQPGKFAFSMLEARRSKDLTCPSLSWSQHAKTKLSPDKNSCDMQVPRWRHISCHTDENRYYLVMAKRPRRYAQQLEATKAPNKQQNGFNPWAGRCECTNWPAGFELIPEPFSCKSNPRPQRLRLNAPQQIRDSH